MTDYPVDNAQSISAVSDNTPYLGTPGRATSPNMGDTVSVPHAATTPNSSLTISVPRASSSNTPTSSMQGGMV